MDKTKILTKKNQFILYTKLTDYLKEVLDDEENFYQKGKEKTRNEAIDWQADFANHNYSYGELAYFSDYFEAKARRYGLVKEFKENGII